LVVSLLSFFFRKRAPARLFCRIPRIKQPLVNKPLRVTVTHYWAAVVGRSPVYQS
jgi:hypothetical protein